MSNLIPVDQIQTMAQAVAASKLFGISTQEQAMALMLIAQAEGLHPAIAARDYHIIKGRPALKADAMLARFQTAGGKVEWLKYTDTVVSAKISHPQGGAVTIEWTIEMAKRAGLTGNQTWSNYPRQMLRARVISEGIRTVYPGVAVGVYTPEEVSDFEPAKDARIVEVEAVEVKTAEPKAKNGASTAEEWAGNQSTQIRTLSLVQLTEWERKNEATLKRLADKSPAAFDALETVIADRRSELRNFGIAAE